RDALLRAVLSLAGRDRETDRGDQFLALRRGPSRHRPGDRGGKVRTRPREAEGALADGATEDHDRRRGDPAADAQLRHGALEEARPRLCAEELVVLPLQREDAVDRALTRREVRGSGYSCPGPSTVRG